MSYFKYHCTECDAYYGNAIPFDEFPHDKVCENCETPTKSSVIKIVS
jgi:hypothetical protein